MTSRILAVGSDDLLVKSRASILNSRYKADTCRPEDCLQKLTSAPFDLLLVCSSIHFDSAYSLVRQVHRQFPHIYIVRLLAPDSPRVEHPIAHKLITIDFRPELWMKAVDQLLQPDTPNHPNHN
jgi:hypothetical protein